MKLSTKCRYGIRAVIEIAKNNSPLPTKRKNISQSQGIPNSYLENILIVLKNNNIVASVRGAGGGFKLKRPPEEISVLDVFEALQGKLVMVDCIEDPDSCDRSDDCNVRPLWAEMEEAQKEILSRKSIKDLMDEDNNS